MLKIGQTVPDIHFQVYQNDQFKDSSLSAYKGKWLILLFYPADFTFVCPTELEDAQKYYDNFGKNGAEVLSVSTDTVFVHKAWHDASPAIGKITYPMAADPKAELSKAFGTYIEEEGLSLRGTFIIDPDGVLKALDIHDNSIGRNAGEIFRKFEAASFVREHPGLVCPANWVPGANTLRPGIDLVGKI